jgi:hypothetical protein
MLRFNRLKNFRALGAVDSAICHRTRVAIKCPDAIFTVWKNEPADRAREVKSSATLLPTSTLMAACLAQTLDFQRRSPAGFVGPVAITTEAVFFSELVLMQVGGSTDSGKCL